MPTDVLYCEGPGDLVSSYETWKRGGDFTKETSVTFSGQFFEFCRLERLTFHAVSYCGRAHSIVDGPCTISNLPRQDIQLPKVGYELSVLVYALRLLLLALRVRPQVIFVASGVIDWAYLGILRLSGAKVVPILHNTLWPEGFRPKIGLRQRAYRFVWQRCVWSTLAVSPACVRQVHAVAGPVPVTVFKPSFPPASFVKAEPQSLAKTPFRVMFAGRIERDKGVFDILDMAEELPHVEFSLCGDGQALPELQCQINGRRLENVTTHGKLDRTQLLSRYREAHVVIVPTRSTFAEGFAMVVAEAILLLRPVISNPVVPAAEVLRSAVISVLTDDVAGYVAAILELSGKDEAYSRLIDNAAALRPIILDDSTSLLEIMKTTRKRPGTFTRIRPK
jgi:glycosyltransferase involved in cell wall biosynthesis